LDLPNLPSASSITPNDLLILVGGVMFFIVIIVLITEIGAWLRHRSLIKNLQKNPEIAEKLLKLETEGKIRRYTTELVPKRVKVIVLQQNGETQLEDICKYDGEMITCKKLRMQFVPSTEVRPKPTLYRGKIILTYYFTEDGKPVDVKVDNNGVRADIKAPDPRMTEVIINKKLINQVFSHLGLNMSSIMMGVGIGAMVVVVLVFFILPLVGIPVSVGKQVVEVIHVNQTAVSAPPGNYTVTFP